MKHDVDFTIPYRPLGNSDIQFNVKQDGTVLGSLKISKGSVVWRPKDNSYGYRLSWSKFNELMQNSGVREK